MDNLSKEESLDDLINHSVVLIVQFGTDTCAPCTAIKQKIDIWSVNYENIDEDREIS